MLRDFRNQLAAGENRTWLTVWFINQLAVAIGNGMLKAAKTGAGGNPTAIDFLAGRVEGIVFYIGIFTGSGNCTDGCFRRMGRIHAAMHSA